jgi:hypothetical protein
MIQDGYLPISQAYFVTAGAEVLPSVALDLSAFTARP